MVTKEATVSYSLTVTAARGDLKQALGDEVARIEQQSTEAADERTDHLTAALVVLDRMLEAVGRPEDDVIVSIIGHANPDHAPAEDWANEQLTISVTARPVTTDKET